MANENPEVPEGIEEEELNEEELDAVAGGVGAAVTVPRQLDKGVALAEGGAAIAIAVGNVAAGVPGGIIAIGGTVVKAPIKR